MLADHRPNGILVNRQLTKRHLGIEYLKRKKRGKKSIQTTGSGNLSTPLIRDTHLSVCLLIFPHHFKYTFKAEFVVSFSAACRHRTGTASQWKVVFQPPVPSVLIGHQVCNSRQKSLHRSLGARQQGAGEI